MDMTERIRTSVIGHELTHSLLSRTNAEAQAIVTYALVDHTGHALTFMHWEWATRNLCVCG